MINLHCLCTYCGTEWRLTVFSEYIDSPTCEKCKDKNVKVTRYTPKDVFGYDSDNAKPDAYIKRK